MKARIHVITLAVADFERALAFYRTVGATAYLQRAETLLTASG